MTLLGELGQPRRRGLLMGCELIGQLEPVGFGSTPSIFSTAWFDSNAAPTALLATKMRGPYASDM